MTDCPACHALMPATRYGNRPRTYCCHACAITGSRDQSAAVDPAAVDRLVHGEAVSSTRGERVEATRVLAARGRSYTQIAALLRVTPTSVWRYVVQLRNQKEAA